MKHTKVTYLLIMVVAMLACNRLDEAAIPLQMTPCASAPQARASATAFVVDEQAYVVCGRGAYSGKLLSDFWTYDPTADTWSELEKIPFKPRVQALSHVVNGKAYVGLGFSGNVYLDKGYLTDFWMYDATDSTWTQKASYPIKATSGTSSFVVDQYIYVGFGFSEVLGFNDHLYRYDTALDTWEACTELPWWTCTAGTAVSVGDRHFAGFGYNTKMKNDWYEYFPESDTWEKRRSPGQRGRVFLNSFALGEKGYIIGGRFFGGTEGREEFYDEILAYDPSNDEWTLAGRIPDGGRENIICFTIGDKAYFGMGENADGKTLNDLYCTE